MFSRKKNEEGEFDIKTIEKSRSLYKEISRYHRSHEELQNKMVRKHMEIRGAKSYRATLIR